MSRQRAFCFRASVVALASVFSGAPFANPANPSVVAGQAVFQQSGKTLTVTNTPGTIINWQSFNIDRGELTRFIQQNAASQVLNRVTGGDPSKILGSLQSNGRVILINPNGVAFGAGAQVDVAGLLVSTLQIKDADFLAGKLRFNDTPGAGSIKNEGSIRTASGGQVILIAPQIENSGLIHAPEGQILLAAGRSVTIADPERPAIQVEITNSEQTAVNLGTLIGKEISLYGGLVKNSGTIQATTAVVGENGRIRLRATHGVENTGTLQANGLQGGDILVQAEQGMVRVAGVIEARGLAPIEIAKATPAAPQLGKGGRIEILAPEIDVNATIDASGTAGGGAVFIGGDYQGGSGAVPVAWQDNAALKRASLALEEPFSASPSLREASSFSPSAPDNGQQGWLGGSAQPGLPARPLPAARTLRFGNATRVRADAIEEGDGGVIVAWADGVTRAQGEFSARGGAIGGDGGLVEISGKGLLNFSATVDTSAAHGQRGMLLLDPTNITIGATANINGDGSTGDDIAAATDLDTNTNYGAVTSLITATQLTGLLDTTDVTLAATNDITISSAIAKTGAIDTTLTLNAGNNININAGVSSTSSRLNLVLNADADLSGAGTVIFGAATHDLGGGTLNATGGGGRAQIANSITLNGATADFKNLTWSSGTLSLTGAATVNGTLTLSGGTLTGGGSLTTKGTTNSAWGTTTIVNGATWNNQGTVNLSGRIGLMNGATFNNAAGATLNMTSWHLDAIYIAPGNGTLNNSGTINQLNASGARIGVGFNNSGVVAISGGDLELQGSGSDSGSYTISAGRILDLAFASRTISGSISGAGTLRTNYAQTTNFASGSTLNVGTLNGGTGTITFEAGSNATIGTLNLSGNGTVNFNGSSLAMTNFVQSVGTVNLTSGAPLALSSLNMSGGTFNANNAITVSGTATLGGSAKLAGAATLNTQGATSIPTYFIFQGSTWNNSGTASINGSGTVIATAGATINNAIGATLNLASSGATPVTLGSSGTNVFNNAGTINHTVAGTHAIGTNGGTSSFTNSGTVNVSSGTLRIETGGTDTGNYAISSGAELYFWSGTRNLGGAVSGAGMFSSNGTTNVTAGSSLNVGSLYVAGGTLSLATGSSVTVPSLTLAGGTLNTSDVLTVSGNTSILTSTLAGTGSLNTNGTTTINTGTAFSLASGATWNNSGNATVNGYVNITSGTLNNQSGATLNLNTSAINPLVLSGTGVINNAGTLTQQSSGVRTISNSGSGTFNNTGLVDIQNGTLVLREDGLDSGSYKIGYGAMLELAAGNRTMTSDSRVFEESASMGLKLSGGSLDFYGTYELNNFKMPTVTGGALLFSPTNTVSPNDGVFTASSGSFTWGANVSFGQYSNSGATSVFSSNNSVGTLTLSGGTVTVDGNMSVAYFTMTNGTLNGSGTLTATDSLAWTAGTMSGIGSTVLAAGGAGSISTASIKLLSRTLRNEGVLTESGATAATSFRIDGTGVLENIGTFNIADNSRIDTAATAGQIFNSGTFAKTGGTGTSYIYVPLTNQDNGQLQADTGVLRFNSGLNTTGSGLGTINGGAGVIEIAGTSTLNGNLDIGSGATLRVTSGTHTVSNGVTLGSMGTGSLEVSVGTLTLDGDASIGDFNLSGGGTLNGSGTLTASNSLNWTGGTMSGTGVTVLASGGTGTITTTGIKTLSRTLRNEGEITVSGVTGAGYPFRIQNGGVLDNVGTFNIADDSRIEYYPGQVIGQILNSGTFAKTGGTGSSYVNALMNNTGGTLQADSGLLDIVADTTLSGTSTLNGNIAWRLNANVTLEGDVIGSTGLQIGTNGPATVVANGDVSVNKLTIAQNGTLSGTGTITVTDTLDWTGGTMSGTGVTVLASGGTGTITTTGIKTLSRTLRNEGEITVSGVTGAGYPFRIQNGGVLDNVGTFNIADDSRIEYAPGNVAGQILNSGTFAKTGGTGQSYIGVALTNQSGGALQADSGTLRLNSGLNTTGAGTIGGGAGVVELAGTSVLASELTIGTGATLKQVGGSLSLADDAVLLGNGIFNWSAGTINVTGAGTGATIGYGMTLDIGNRTIGGGGKLTNDGTMRLNGATLNVELVNFGQMDVLGGGNAINGSSFDMEAGAININGGAELRKQGGVVNWRGGEISGPGQLIASSGASINIVGNGDRVLRDMDLAVSNLDMTGGSLFIENGLLSIQTGVIRSGASIQGIDNTVDVNGHLVVEGYLGVRHILGSGSMTLSGTLELGTDGYEFSTVAIPVNNHGHLRVWNWGELSAGGEHTGTFTSEQQISFSGGHIFRDGAKLSGSGGFVGTAQIVSTGSSPGLVVDAGTSLDLNAMTLTGSGMLTNNGSVTANGTTLGTSLSNHGYANLTDTTILGTLLNTGGMDISGSVVIGGASATLQDGFIFLHDSAVLVKDSGTLYWSGGAFEGSGTLSYINGASFAFAGSGNRVIDNPNLTFAFSDLALPDGSLSLYAGGLTFNTSTGATVIPENTFLKMYGGTITNNGPLNISGTFGLYGGALTGAGAINMTSGTIDMPADSTLNWMATGPMSNSGTLNLGNRTITNAFTNTGTINATGGLTFTQLFTNQGAFNLTGGTTTFSAGYLQTAGTTMFNGGNAAGNMTLSGGVLGGSGTLTGNLINNGGALNVGFSPGTLNIAGNLVLGPSSITNVELGGTTPGSGFDLINVSGTATLDGTLNVLAYGGYTPGAGTNYSFMNFASSSGAFSSTNMPGGWSMTMNSLATYLDLLAAGVLPPVVPPVSPALPAIIEIANDVIQGQTITGFNRGDAPEGDLGVVQSLFQSTQFAQNEEDFLSLRQCQ